MQKSGERTNDVTPDASVWEDEGPEEEEAEERVETTSLPLEDRANASGA
jgi:hypothetical protein